MFTALRTMQTVEYTDCVRAVWASSDVPVPNIVANMCIILLKLLRYLLYG